jgi:hypothetical protein
VRIATSVAIRQCLWRELNEFGHQFFAIKGKNLPLVCALFWPLDWAVVAANVVQITYKSLAGAFLNGYLGSGVLGCMYLPESANTQVTICEGLRKDV